MKDTSTFVGLDAHKESIFVAMLVPGQRPVEWQLRNEPTAVRRLVRSCSRSSTPSSRRRAAPNRSRSIPTAPKSTAFVAGGSRRSAPPSGASLDLTRIDGISTKVAQVVVTEVGPNLAAFPSEDAFVSWLRLCPRTPISGGKPLKKRRNGLGANRIATVLRMAATTVQRSQTALGASFRRLARRKGAAVAVFAIARHLAKLIYRMLRFGQDYVDVGAQAYERRFQLRRLAGITQAPKSLGFTLVPQTAEAAPG